MDAMDAGASSRNLGLFIKLNAVYRVGHNEFRMSKMDPSKEQNTLKKGPTLKTIFSTEYQRSCV